MVATVLSTFSIKLDKDALNQAYCKGTEEHQRAVNALCCSSHANNSKHCKSLKNYFLPLKRISLLNLQLLIPSYESPLTFLQTKHNFNLVLHMVKPALLFLDLLINSKSNSPNCLRSSINSTIIQASINRSCKSELIFKASNYYAVHQKHCTDNQTVIKRILK